LSDKPPWNIIALDNNGVFHVFALVEVGEPGTGDDFTVPGQEPPARGSMI
jgi:hypothetical protein